MWSPHFHPKVTAGIFASYVSVVAIYAAAYYGYHIDGILGSAVDGILTTIFAYFMPSDDTALTAENLTAILARFQPTLSGDYHAQSPFPGGTLTLPVPLSG